MFKRLADKVLKKPSAISNFATFRPVNRTPFTIGGQGSVLSQHVLNDHISQQMHELFATKPHIYQEVRSALENNKFSGLSHDAEKFLDDVPLVHPHGVKDIGKILEFFRIGDQHEVITRVVKKPS